jgi:hypothetical protein
MGHKKQRQERAEARARGELPPWTGPRLPRAYHNTPEGRREANLRPPVDPELLLPPVQKTAEEIEEGKRQLREHLKATKEGRITPFESLIQAVQNSLTVGQLREALKPRYYGDYRYKPVEGAPPAGSAPSPAAQQLKGATSQQKSNSEVKIIEGATYHPETEGATHRADSNPEREVVEGATSREEKESFAQEGATYLMEPITLPIEGVKRKQTAVQLVERSAPIPIEEKEEEEELLQLLNRSSEESDYDIDSIPYLSESELHFFRQSPPPVGRGRAAILRREERWP